MRLSAVRQRLPLVFDGRMFLFAARQDSIQTIMQALTDHTRALIKM